MLEFGYGTFLVDHWPYVIHQTYIKELFHLNPLWKTQHVDKKHNILQADKHLYRTMNGYERASLQNKAIHKQGCAKVHQCETETQGCTRDITAHCQ